MSQARLVVAEDASRLASIQPLIASPIEAPAPGRVVEALATGDVALLHDELLLAPGGLARQCVRAAIDGGWPAVPIPGPSLPLTALVVSGLPADSFLFLGWLARLGRPLSSLAAERRTLVALETAGRLPATLAELLAALGDRPLAIAAGSTAATPVVWRGTLAGLAAYPADSGPDDRVLIVGGAGREAPAAWDEDRLRAEVQSRLARGLGAREIAQQLAAESGWPRRLIYRLATQSGPRRPS